MRSFMKVAAFAAIASTATAQTFSSCNPMKKDDCPNNPAICSSFASDFTIGDSAMGGWTTTAGNLTYGDDGAKFTVGKKGEAPTIQTNGYMFTGYAEVKMKAAPGTGIVSSIVLQSEDLDEVDWEFIGGDNANVQSNYFGKGNTTSYDRMIPYPVRTPQQTSHTYAVNWTESSIVWLIDGNPMRTLNAQDAVGGKNFPQTPMNLRIGIWAGGDADNDKGTISWAGGQTDYSQAPFTMTVESVKIENYNAGKAYSWTDKSGSLKSINTLKGECTSSDSGSTDAGARKGGKPSASSSAAPLGVAGPAGPKNGTHTASSPGSFIPTAVPSSNTTSESCGDVTVTVTITAKKSATSSVAAISPPATPETPVPTSMEIDTGVPTLPASAALPTTPAYSGAIGGSNATASTTGASQFTGAASANGIHFGSFAAMIAAAVFAL